MFFLQWYSCSNVLSEHSETINKIYRVSQSQFEEIISDALWLSV